MVDASEGGDDGERREKWGANEPLERSWLVPREKQLLWAKDSYGRCLARRRRSHRIRQGRDQFFLSLLCFRRLLVPVVGDLLDDVATICNLHGLGPV